MATGEVWKWGYWGRRRPGFVTVGVEFCCLYCDWDASGLFDICEKDYRLDNFDIVIKCRMCGKDITLHCYK